MNSLTPYSATPLDVPAIKEQVNAIQRVMKSIMKRDTHYGQIPGCGDKPVLLKPGAEKICMTFRLGLQIDINFTDLQSGHREYQCKARLVTPDGHVAGEGIGICSTLESKYRYRWDNTGQEVPREYWNTRDKELIGGEGRVTRKVKGTWFIFQREEHDNPADYYNTVAKMAKKRAHVDAVLTATAASDIFEQDLDEAPPISDPAEDVPPAPSGPAAPAATAATGPINESQQRILTKKAEACGISIDAVAEKFGVQDIKALPVAQINDALQWLEAGGD